VLDALRMLDPLDPRFVAVQRAAAHLTKHAKQQRRLARRRDGVRVDRQAAMASRRAQAYFAPAVTPSEPPPRELRRARHCYVCKAPYRALHAFYHALCPPCAARNFAARTARVELTGRRAIVTGGRTKIGFEVARWLLESGAHVTITTRFPGDARRRFAALPCDRLEIVGLDFRDLRGVLGWLDERARGAPLDILVNNAAQTVWRPPAYYARLSAAEQPQLTTAIAAIDALTFPAGTDEEGKQLDLRAQNSWVHEAADVAPIELVEAHVINAIVPFLFASRLRERFTASAFADRYIVNVSAMEGVFAYANKQPRHPHTNMAKAALNMFTRTSAADYARDRIYMTSVDTGWITQENPQPGKLRAEAGGFCPPLDVVDGAARIVAPILDGICGAPMSGVLLKDFAPIPW
jgi:NAD(P)-dependent dehydrogenase (short-subunit alcohol dehydrogenase family)